MDTHQMIKLRKACANNLKNVDLDLPKRRITVFTGVSGSGKSSLVFDTIGSEARRQISELFSTFARVRMPAANAAEVFHRLNTAKHPPLGVLLDWTNVE